MADGLGGGKGDTALGCAVSPRSTVLTVLAPAVPSLSWHHRAAAAGPFPAAAHAPWRAHSVIAGSWAPDAETSRVLASF